MMLLRYALIALGTWAASKGWIPLDGMEEAAGALIVAATALWGLWARRPAAQVASVAAMPDVTVYSSDPKLARAAATASNS